MLKHRHNQDIKSNKDFQLTCLPTLQFLSSRQVASMAAETVCQAKELREKRKKVNEMAKEWEGVWWNSKACWATRLGNDDVDDEHRLALLYYMKDGGISVWCDLEGNFEERWAPVLEVGIEIGWWNERQPHQFIWHQYQVFRGIRHCWYCHSNVGWGNGGQRWGCYNVKRQWCMDMPNTGLTWEYTLTELNRVLV